MKYEVLQNWSIEQCEDRKRRCITGLLARRLERPKGRMKRPKGRMERPKGRISQERHTCAKLWEMAEACLAETEAAARIAVAFGLNREGLTEAEVAGCNACEMACRYACCKASSDSPAAATDPDRL